MIWKIKKGAAAGQGAAPERIREKGVKFLETLGKVQERGARQGQSLSRGRKVLRPISMTHASRLAYFSPIIHRCAAKYRVPVALICGVMLQESGGNPKAVSHCGARGLMQLMPATARRMGVGNIMDPRQNIEGGVRYLRLLLDRFRGDVKLAVAAYNCGEGNVEKYGNRIPPFAETRAYVPNVLAYAETIHHILRGAGRPAAVAQPNALPTGEALAGRFVKLA